MFIIYYKLWHRQPDTQRSLSRVPSFVFFSLSFIRSYSFFCLCLERNWCTHLYATFSPVCLDVGRLHKHHSHHKTMIIPLWIAFVHIFISFNNVPNAYYVMIFFFHFSPTFFLRTHIRSVGWSPVCILMNDESETWTEVRCARNRFVWCICRMITWPLRSLLSHQKVHAHGQ